MFRLLAILIILIGLGLPESNAQMWFLGQKGKKKSPFPVFKKHSSLSFGAGSSHYIGDLLPVGGLITAGAQATRWNVGATITRHLSPNFSASLGLNYIRIAGDDNYFPAVGYWDANFTRNLHFRNDIKEISLVGIYEIGGNLENNLKRNAVSPYVFLGVAGFLHAPDAREQAMNSGTSAVNAPWISERGRNLSYYQNEGVAYSLAGISIPFGVGIRYKLNDNMDLGFDFCYRVALTDYLDDVTDIRNTIIPGSVPGALMIYTNRSTEPFAANTLDNRTGRGLVLTSPKISVGPDQYFTTQVRIIYHLRNKVDCPPLPN